ncbi:MAG: LysE family transporter [Pseudomonadota bacterium]
MAAVATILFAAAITPGPNNLVVMNAARAGIRAAIAPIAGVVLGTLIIVLTLRIGAAAAISAQPAVDSLFRLGGAGLLAFLAWRMALSGWVETGSNKPEGNGSALFFSMAALQVVNPKTWVLATTVSATHAAQTPSSLAALAVSTALVPTLCLLTWAIVGRGLDKLLERPMLKKAFALLMALILLSFALAILLEPRTE